MTPEQLVKEALLSPIYSLLQETPLQPARRLSASIGHNILLKREDLHPIFSFKVRGACNKILKMPAARRQKGVVAASAGNHAQGVAFAARACGVPARIFMPSPTPSIKVEAVQSHGAKVSLDSYAFDETLKNALAYARKHKLPFVHPFDDYDIICGQATVGLELLREARTPIDAVFVCCGGGGLLAGIATVIKQLRPSIKVFGVEPQDAASMTEALRRDKLYTLPYVGNFVETAAVARVGKRTFELCKQYVDDMIIADTGSICNAIKEIYEDTRVIVEPAGALGVVGARKYAQKLGKNNGKSLVAIVSGANMNFDVLRYVIERTSSGEAGEMLLAAEIPEKPGSFLELCSLLGDRHVTEFNYRFSSSAKAHIFAGIELKNEKERGQIMAKLRSNGISCLDLTGDETAELHVRHMVGGRADLGQDEQVYRIEFPERPGALQYFLKALHKGWNISLFHYRFHGANVGRVLVGFQLPASKRPELEKMFRKIGYPFWDVDKNVAYDMFLADPNQNS